MSNTAKVIAFSNQKGGTGKTTSCLAIAAFLSASHKILIVDLDPQAHASSSFGEELDGEQASIYDVLIAECGDYQGAQLDEAIYQTAYANIDLVPAELDLALAELTLYEAQDKVWVLAGLLEQVQEQYDYILIDLPPHLGMLMMNGLFCADKIVMPVEPSWYGMESVKNFNAYRKEVEEDTGTVFDNLLFLLTRYKKAGLWNFFGDSPADEIKQQLKSYGEPVFIIPEDKAVLAAQRQKKLLTEIAPSCAAAKAYQKIASHLAENN